jgi:DMSO/TMAO reductase YedYZ heme-binding membrane subunit
VGAAAFYVLVIVIVTSLFRLRMARPLWRKLHCMVFPRFILMFIHSVFTDPALSNDKVDLLDGGKVFVEICCAISLATWAVRMRLRGRGVRARSRAVATV